MNIPSPERKALNKVQVYPEWTAIGVLSVLLLLGSLLESSANLLPFSQIVSVVFAAVSACCLYLGSRSGRILALYGVGVLIVGKGFSLSAVHFLCIVFALVVVLPVSISWIAGSSGIKGILCRLRKQEQELTRFRLLAERAKNILFITDRAGGVQWVNGAFTELTGWQLNEILGKRTESFLRGPDTNQEAATRMLAALEAGDSFRDELLKYGKRGNTFWLEIDLEPIKDKTGNVVGFTGVEYDISEKKRTEEKFRIQEALLQEAGALARFGGWELNLQTMKPLWTDEVYRIHEVEPVGREIQLEEAILFYAPEARSRIQSAVELSIQEGKSFDLELPLITANSKSLWVRSIGKPEFVNGKCVKLRGCFQDITEMRKVKEELSNLNERLLLAAEASQLGVWEWSVQTDTLSWDEKMFEIFEIPRETFSGSIGDWGCVLTLEDTERVKNTYREAEKGNGRVDIELQICTPSGKKKYTRTIAAIHKDENQIPVRVIGTSTDITDWKNAELAQERLRLQLQQAQKMEAIGTLAGGIAHDFNNILGSIIGFTELAKLQSKNESQVLRHTEAVLSSCVRAKQLIHQILAFSRQQESFEKHPVQLGKLIGETCRLLRAAIPTNIEIETRGNERPECILANETQIHQIVMNLVTNAAHAIGGRGRVLIQVGYENLKTSKGIGRIDIPAGQYLVLTVADSGSGIPSEIIDRIFEPFFTTKGPDLGSGLGLSVVHGIVMEQGGFIAVENGSFGGEYLGAVFHIYFPIVCAEPKEESYLQPEISVVGEGLSVLLVEDDVALGESLKLYLEAVGFVVEWCTRPSIALDCLQKKQNRYEVILSDFAMPEMNGLEFAREIRRFTAEVPIVLESGYLGDLLPTELKLLGVAEVLEKPVSMSALVESLRNAARR